MSEGNAPDDEQLTAIEHLYAALQADDPDEKQYHVRLALQLLGIDTTDD